MVAGELFLTRKVRASQGKGAVTPGGGDSKDSATEIDFLHSFL